MAKEQQESFEKKQKTFNYICREKFENKYLKDKKYCIVKYHCHYTAEYRGTVHGICNLKYKVPKNISIVFYNGSSYDYSFIIKELAEEFKKQPFCSGENTEKYITFTVPIEREVTRTDKNGEKITKNICYILQFIDSARFMARFLSNLSIIFLKELIEVNVNTNIMIKNVKLVQLNISIATVFFNRQILRMI